MKAIQKSLLALALAGAFTSANATPVDWTLNNVRFDYDYNTVNTIDFTRISGSFTYDADTNLFSNVNLASFSNYSSLASSTFSSITGSANQITVIGSNIIISFASPLTNAGGTVGLASGKLGIPSAYTLVAGQSITGVPQATASAVPEPEAYAMMLAGLGLVGFAARRKLS